MSSSAHDPLHEPGHERLFRNSLLVAVGQASVGLLFLVYVLGARLLGAASFGDFALGLTIATVFAALPSWGTARYASILAARDPSRTLEIASSSVGLTIPLALAYLPLLWITASLVTPRPAVVGVAVFLGVDLLAREYAILLRLLLRVHDRFGVDALTVIAERALMVLGAGAGLLVGRSAVALAAGMAGGRLLGAGVTTAFFVREVGGFRPRFEGSKIRRLWGGGSPIALRRAIGSLSFRVDTLFLGVMRSAQEVGWYGTVYTLMDGVLMLPGIVTGSIGPTLSANFGQGRRDVVTRLYRRGLKYLLIVGIFFAAALGVLADPVIALLYGEDYGPSAAALRILAVAVVFVFLRRHATEVLDNVDLRSSTAWIFGAGMIANIVLNFLLIPRYGYLGAAASTVLTEGYLMAAMLWTLQRAEYSARLWSMLRAPVGSVVVPAILMVQLAGSPLVAIVLAVSAYLAGLTLLGVWDEKDRLLFRDLRKRALRSRTP